MSAHTTIVDLADLMVTPWRMGGRFPRGVDCYGLIVEVRKRAGLYTPDPWGEGGEPWVSDPDGLPRGFTDCLLPLYAPADYCAVQMLSRWPGGHAGVYLPDKTLLHAGREQGVVRVPLHRIKPKHILGLYDFRVPA